MLLQTFIVDIVKAIVIRNYIKFGEHVKKTEMKIFMAGLTRLRYFAASTQGKYGSTLLIILQLSFCGFGCGSQDHSFPGPFIPWNFRSRYPGPFLPRTIRSFVSRAAGPLTKKEQRLYFTEFFRTVDILLLVIFHSRHSTFALKIIILRLAVLCSGNALVSINAVALHRARLVLGWVTAFGQVNCLIT